MGNWVIFKINQDKQDIDLKVRRKSPDVVSDHEFCNIRCLLIART